MATPGSHPHGLDSSLVTAVRDGTAADVRKLIAAGANINAVDRWWGSWDGRTPLIWAITGNKPLIVDELIKAGANLELNDAKRGQTPLIWAVRDGTAADVRKLIAAGANINAVDLSESGRTPLIWAINDDKPLIVDELIKAGVNIELRDKRNAEPPLFWALRGPALRRGELLRRGANPLIVKALIEAEVNVDAADESGLTPLMVAATRKSAPMVRALIEAGANVAAVDNQMRTANSHWLKVQQIVDKVHQEHETELQTWLKSHAHTKKTPALSYLPPELQRKISMILYGKLKRGAGWHGPGGAADSFVHFFL